MIGNERSAETSHLNENIDLPTLSYHMLVDKGIIKHIYIGLYMALLSHFIRFSDLKKN